MSGIKEGRRITIDNPFALKFDVNNTDKQPELLAWWSDHQKNALQEAWKKGNEVLKNGGDVAKAKVEATKILNAAGFGYFVKGAVNTTTLTSLIPDGY